MSEKPMHFTYIWWWHGIDCFFFFGSAFIARNMCVITIHWYRLFRQDIGSDQSNSGWSDAPCWSDWNSKLSHVTRRALKWNPTLGFRRDPFTTGLAFAVQCCTLITDCSARYLVLTAWSGINMLAKLEEYSNFASLELFLTHLGV